MSMKREGGGAPRHQTTSTTSSASSSSSSSSTFPASTASSSSTAAAISAASVASAMALATGGTAPAPAAKVPKVNNGSFDVAAYVAGYRGHTAVQRILFIAERCDDLHAKCCAALESARTKSHAHVIFRAAWDRLRALGASPRVDSAWADAEQRASHDRLERLDSELAQCRSSGNKEGARAACAALAEENYNAGDVASALKLLLRARDFAGTPTQSAETQLNAAKCAIELGNLASAASSVAKAEGLNGVDEKLLVGSRTRVLGAVLQLESKAYRTVAKKLLEVSPELGDAMADVVSNRDVAVYAGLCALATFDRSELKKSVVDNSAFREWLESAPDMRAVIDDFYSCRYAPCLAALERMRKDLLLDLHMAAHANALLQRIREKAMVQYFGPYSSVDLRKMATAFAVPVEVLEKELSRLITDDHIQARIDSQAKVMHARTADQRHSTFESAIRAGAEFQADATALLMRVSLVRDDFGVPPGSDKQQGGRMGGGRMGVAVGGGASQGVVPMQMDEEQQIAMAMAISAAESSKETQ